MILSSKNLTARYSFFKQFSEDFNLTLIPPIDRTFLTIFENNVIRTYSQYKNFSFWDYSTLGKLEEYKMIKKLRDLVEFTETKFTDYNTFVNNVINCIEYDTVTELANIDTRFYYIIDSDNPLNLNQLFYQYLAQSYIGFVKEHRTKFIIASHFGCINGDFELYYPDYIADSHHKIDLFIFRKRIDNSSDGYWKSIGVISSLSDNKTQGACSIIIKNNKHLDRHYPLNGTSIYVAPISEIDYRITDSLSL